VLQAAWDAGLTWLAIAAVIASVISAFYYLRIIYIMYFGEVSETLDGKIPMLHMGLLTASAAALVFGIVNMFGVEGYALTAARALLG
jgi:NADH-quinone oxidoreductase subunit N